ncbi:MAG: Bcr/CflA family multidrug efflux MFS transporter [Alphaproteobacteria bacterium]|nr:Bcr/CflA family multidrug efflux MFS transporter [Alphaproteobacteria bacterium]
MSGEISKPSGGTRGLTVILGALAALGAAAIDMYLPSLPMIESDLAPGSGQAQFTLSAFFVGLGIGQLFYGPASDAFGRRRVLMGGIILYCVASLACAFAGTMEQLIAARFVQALGAASGGVIARAMVRDMFSLNEAARAQSFIALAFSITPLLAPNIGGYILIAFGWRAIFLVLCGFGAVCLFLLMTRVPETLAPENRTPLRFGVLLRNYRRILRERRSVGCILTGAFAFAGMFTFFAASPFVYIEIYGVPYQHYGLLFAMNVLGIMAANYINTRLVIEKGAMAMLRIGSILSAFGGVLLFVCITFEIGGLVGVVVPMIVVVGSLGFVGANAIAGALDPFPTLAGTTASLFGFSQMMLGAVMGGIVGLMHDGTPLPMGILIGATGVLGLVSYTFLVGGGTRRP